MDYKITELIPRDIAEKFLVFALAKYKKRLFVGMSDLTNIYVLDAIKFITGLTATPILMAEEDIRLLINESYLEKDIRMQQEAEATKTSSKFQVFLCYNSKDRQEVTRIALELRKRGVNPWLDIWELIPGIPWQDQIENQISKIDSAVAFVGSEGIGPWQQMEIRAYLREFVNRKCPVIPTILTDCTKIPDLPVFLTGMSWVDFRRNESNPLSMLIWGITGNKNGQT